MPRTDPRVDAFIARSAEFAKPILIHIRETVHSAAPDIEETIKWGMPTFEHQGILCIAAAFKQHCRFGFTKPAEIAEHLGWDKSRVPAMEQYLTVKELPAKRLIVQCVRAAIAVNAERARRPRSSRATATKSKKPAVRTPSALRAALAANPAAAATYKAFSPSHRREYAEWIAEAKTDATRNRRVATALEWLEAGKPHNWKYAGKR